MNIHDSETFRTLHILGEHVLCAARYESEGHIGLTVVPGGIATPPFGDDRRSIGVVDGELVVRDRHGETRAPVTTLRGAGQLTGTTVGAPANVYPPKTPCRLDDPLVLDRDEFGRICEWYALVAEALHTFRSEISADEPSDVVLWPEHFDVAIRVAEVNYGGLIGDDKVAAPYVYVGPPTSALSGKPEKFWNASFGAVSTEDVIGTVDDAVSFFRVGRTRAAQLLARHG